MTGKEFDLLRKVKSGQITVDEFHKAFPIDIKASKNYVVNELTEAIKTNSAEDLDIVISLIWLSGTDQLFVDVLNQLLINPNHKSHQIVTRTLQDLKSPTTVPFIKQVLESNFEFLAYTCSDSDAIAKWFSWALYEIGTKDAISLIKQYTKSPDAGISKEMNYRLKKYRHSPQRWLKGTFGS